VTGVKSVRAAQVFPFVGLEFFEFDPLLTVTDPVDGEGVTDGWVVAVILAGPAFVVRAFPSAVFVGLPASFGDLGCDHSPGGLTGGIGGFLALT
jgi:hypothetical protein